MKFLNGFSSKLKQADKFELTIRVSKLTILEVYYDLSDKKFKFVFMNMGTETEKKKADK